LFGDGQRFELLELLLPFAGSAQLRRNTSDMLGGGPFKNITDAAIRKRVCSPSDRADRGAGGAGVG
jgi:hypothetical protein